MLRLHSRLLRSTARSGGGSGVLRGRSPVVTSAHNTCINPDITASFANNPSHIAPNCNSPPVRTQRRSLHLTPRETDHLHLHSAGRLAQYRLARGLKLNVPEARALIAMQMMELVRNGSAPTVTSASGGSITGGMERLPKMGERGTDAKIVQREGTVSDLMGVGTQLLGRNQVLPGVAGLVREVQVEATFPDGTKLLTVHDPISREDGDLGLALEGSFLPVPDLACSRVPRER